MLVDISIHIGEMEATSHWNRFIHTVKNGKRLDRRISLAPLERHDITFPTIANDRMSPESKRYLKEQRQAIRLRSFLGTTTMPGSLKEV